MIRNQCQKYLGIRALILAAGFSRRMGQDKALLRYYDKSELERWRDIFSELHIPLCLSARKEQLPRDVCPEIERIYDAEPNIGPMSGLLSAFEHDPLSAWMVLACDWPLLCKEDVCHLIEGRQPLHLATSLGHCNQIEPLFTIYEPQIQFELKRARIEQRLSLKALLSQVTTTVVEARDPSLLINANDPYHRQVALQKIKSQPIKP